MWECSVDLCEYLLHCSLVIARSQVLELGCGGGLPGMLAAKMGAASVHFQDFVNLLLRCVSVCVWGGGGGGGGGACIDVCVFCVLIR